MKAEIEWYSVDKLLPDAAQYVLVHCEGGNISTTFYSPHREMLASRHKNSHYSRKRQGKNSGYFDISHEYGYKILHWALLPVTPKQEEIDNAYK